MKTFDQRLQLIDNESKFNPLLKEHLHSNWALSAAGFNYNVIAVFGSQSTGKSTLLNRLFGTAFDVMNEQTGRQQTTKATDSDLIVLDVEGTDGGERFEDQDFERKSALFSLSVAEVVLVNIFENNVGLYNGANMGLLKTVLDVNLQLFQYENAPKTCIHFVIRDFTNQTPIEKLLATLLSHLEKVWDSLSFKVPVKLTSVFDFKIDGLPHKIFAKDAFESTVAILRAKILKEDFLPLYHRGIPADGFPKYAENIWERIITSKELDVPTQTQLLAEYRCDELARAVLDGPNGFYSAISVFKKLEKGDIIDDFGEIANRVVDSSEFDKSASRYDKTVYAKKREELHSKLSTHIYANYLQLLTNLSKVSLEFFVASLKSKIIDESKDGLPTRKFNEHSQTSKDEALEKFSSGAKNAQLRRPADSDSKSWNWDSQYDSLKTEIDRITFDIRKENINLMIKHIEVGIKTMLLGTVTEGIALMTELAGKYDSNSGLDSPWRSMIISFNDTKAFGVLQLKKWANGFSLSESETISLESNIAWYAWDLLHDTLLSETSDELMVTKLRTVFESSFRNDPVTGAPRIWTNQDTEGIMDVEYSKSVDRSEWFLKTLAKIDLGSNSLGDEILNNVRYNATNLIIIPPARQEVLRTRFKSTASALFLEAKRGTVASISQIPPWFYGLTIILGWNELMFVMFNPLYFILVSLYVTYTLGMMGPGIQIAKAALKEVANQALPEVDKHVPGFSKRILGYLGEEEGTIRKRKPSRQEEGNEKKE